MARSDSKGGITPEECLKRLKPIELDPPADDDSSFRSAELRNSVLLIAKLDHVSETLLIQKSVKNALGKLPPIS